MLSDLKQFSVLGDFGKFDEISLSFAKLSGFGKSLILVESVEPNNFFPSISRILSNLLK